MADGSRPTGDAPEDPEPPRMATDPPAGEAIWTFAEFRIYRTDDGIVPHYSTDPDTEAAQRSAYLGLGAAMRDLQHLVDIHTSGWRPFRKKKAGDALRARIHDEDVAISVAHALLGDEATARTVLAAVRERISREIANRARVVHLGINIVLVLAVLLASGIVAGWGTFGPVPQNAIRYEEVAVAMAMGAIGALFSTSVRLQSMAVDATVTTLMHWVYAGQRVLVGVLGAFVIYFGFKSGVISGLFQPFAAVDVVSGADLNIYWLGFVSILAGFSERLVPNLLESQTAGAQPADA